MPDASLESFSSKVQLFWEGHKNERNRSYGFEIYLVNFKTIRMIPHISVAFSEKLNFTGVIISLEPWKIHKTV